MAIDHLTTLRSEIPSLFNDRPLSEDWDDDWIVIPVDKAEAVTANDLHEEELIDPSYTDAPADQMQGALSDGSVIPDIPGEPFPGAPTPAIGHRVPPPPDALAFYLPFHYFHPTWWGIYIVLEGMHDLAQFIWTRSRPHLSFDEALVVSRVFLYAHEAFHHNVEAFATRLEVTHRKPLYCDGFEKLYRATVGKDTCVEEALASAHGYRRVSLLLFRGMPHKRDLALDALAEYIRGSPPGYRLALDFKTKKSFDTERNRFAEENQRRAIPMAPHHGDGLWYCFSHGFTGISRRNSRVNYIVHRHSPLASRLRLSSRFLTYRNLAKRLLKFGNCSVLRQGGQHEIWVSPGGKRFSVPRHPGDLGPTLLSKIITQAGLSMSVSEFAAAKV